MESSRRVGDHRHESVILIVEPHVVLGHLHKKGTKLEREPLLLRPKNN